MKQKVIVITVEKYSEKTLNKNMKTEFIESGYNFEYWYIGNLKTYFGHVHSKINKKDSDDFLYFNNMKEVIYSINKENKGFISIIQFPINIHTEKLLLLLHQRASKILSIDLNQSLSSFGHYHNKKMYYTNLVKNPRQLIFNLRNKFVHKNLKSKGVFDKIIKFQTGTLYSETNSLTFDDVLTFEKVKTKKRIFNFRYIVFIDVSLPNHPDFKLRGINKTISPTVYYSKLNEFFTKIEEFYDAKVIIAAHPKSNHTNEFYDRIVIYGKTAELIKDSEFIINHYSSSISYAILWNKSILFIYSDEFIYSSEQIFKLLFKRIIIQSNYFKMNAINIDKISKIEKDLTSKVNKEIYRNFINHYLKSSQFPKTNFEIIKKHL